MSHTDPSSRVTANGQPAFSDTNYMPDSASVTSSSCILPRNSMGRARLRMALGLKGLGVYLLVIEALVGAGGRLERDWQTLAYMLGVKEADLRRVIEDFGLFEVRAAAGEEYIVAVENFGAELNTVAVRNSKPNSKPNSKTNIGATPDPTPLNTPNLTDSNASDDSLNHSTGTGDARRRETVGNQVNAKRSVATGNAGFKGNTTSGVYRLGEHREALLQDSEWIAALAAETGLEAGDAAVAFDAFSAYAAGRDDIAYRTEGDMKKHFVNWVRKGCAGKALKKAREAERLRQGREQYEREQAEAHLERKRRAATAVSYDEYCRLKGIETTGSLVSDIHRANNDK